MRRNSGGLGFVLKVIEARRAREENTRFLESLAGASGLCQVIKRLLKQSLE